MIKLTLWERDFPAIHLNPADILTLTESERRPHWSEGGWNKVTVVQLRHTDRPIVVSESVEWIQKLCEDWKRRQAWTPADVIDKPGFNPHIPCRHCNDIHLGAELHHTHDPLEGIGYIRLLAIGGSVEYCFRCGCRKSGWVNVTNEHLQDCPNRKCLCHTAERCH